MIDIIEILKHEMLGCVMQQRQLKKNRARYLYHDASTEQDVIATVYFPEGTNENLFFNKQYFNELVNLVEHNSEMRLRCEIRQL